MRSQWTLSSKLLLALVFATALLALACAKAEEKAAPAPAPAAPAPTAVAAPAPTAVAVPAPAPVAAPAPTKVEIETKGTGLELKIDPRSDEPASDFVRYVLQYHNLKLPLWEKAKYGGTRIHTSLNDKPRYINPFKVLAMGRYNVTGMFFVMDVGTCSLLGRTDFSKCPGVRNNNYKGTLVPGMFEKWGQPDPLTRVFTLRRGILWPAIPPMTRPNREVTSDDVKWYFETQKKEGIFSSIFDSVDSFEIVDRYTIRLKFSRPEADFLRLLSSGGFGIVPKECYEQKGCLDQTLISPGPFILDEGSYVPRTKMTFIKNEEFYLKGLPYLDRLHYVNITDPNALLSAFITGQIDQVPTYTPKEKDSLLRQRPETVTITGICACGSNHFEMRMDKKPFDDVRVRRALSMLIDRPALWKACCDGFAALGMPLAWDYLGLDLPISLKTAGPYNQYNPAEAKRLLKEAGYEKGFTIPVWTGWITRYGTAESLAVIERSYNQVGITLDIKAVDYGTSLATRGTKNWEGFFQDVCYVCAGNDSVSYLLQAYSKSPQNWQGINDPKLDEIIGRGRTELDEKKRQDALWEFVNYMYDQVYGIHYGSPISFQHIQPWLLNASPSLYGYIHFSLGDWVNFVDTDLLGRAGVKR